MRAARGLLESKLSTPKAISEAPLEEEVEALHSEGNVQRGASTCLSLLSNYKHLSLSAHNCKHLSVSMSATLI